MILQCFPRPNNSCFLLEKIHIYKIIFPLHIPFHIIIVPQLQKVTSPFRSSSARVHSYKSMASFLIRTYIHTDQCMYDSADIYVLFT